jgi:adenylate kinase family enzyme
MAAKLFLLGLPGSGKSTVARYIQEYVRKWDWSTSHFSDYSLLQKMFRKDIEHKQFMPADHGGFDVIDFIVFDTALKRLEQKVKRHTSSKKSAELILIEFSRADYQHAFSQFSKKFLRDQDTYFLYLVAELDTCKRRILARTANPIFEDDYHVSDNIFKQYYHQDDGQYLPDILESTYQIDRRYVSIINNNDSLEAASTEINAFVHFIARATLRKDTADTLRGIALSSSIRNEHS